MQVKRGRTSPCTRAVPSRVCASCPLRVAARTAFARLRVLKGRWLSKKWEDCGLSVVTASDFETGECFAIFTRTECLLQITLLI